MKKVLVLCTGNSCRSQMAEGYLRHFAYGKAEIFSAGFAPSFVHPIAIEVMKEDGVDISGQRSKHVNEFQGKDFDYVITVCDNAKENCPFFPAKVKLIHHNFADPTHFDIRFGDKKEAFRKTRDEIKNFCAQFVNIF